MFYTDDFMWEVMGIRDLPDVLYHYTSIETLALVLANRTLRFTRLDKVNDPEEASASDLPNASTLVFASCWTAQPREVLAMWRMYTPNLQGVRIKLPNNPFAGRAKPEIFAKGGAIQRFNGNIEISRANNGGSAFSSAVTGPNKIFYTDDHAYRNSVCLRKEGNQYLVELHDLGMVKNTYWAFEEEWRYKILASFTEGFLPVENPLAHPIFDLVNCPIQEAAVFVPLDETSFDNMEVLLGPCASAGQEEIVRTLLEKYAPNAVLKKSEINIRQST